MLRVWAAGVALLALAFVASPARASGDFTCAPAWTLVHTQYTGCDSVALLGPGNDTRVNLHLLLIDLHGGRPAAPSPVIGGAAPFSWENFEDALSGKPGKTEDYTSEDVQPQSSEFATGEGTRCVSNAGGAAGFETALAAARRLPPDERVRLSDARKAMQPSCEASSGAVLPAVTVAVGPVKSSAGRAFAAYLQGAAAFYDGDFDTAAARFAGLRKAESDWLRQSARYMQGRVELNSAQVNAFDEYGAIVPAKVDAAALAAAESDFKAYLRDDPGGLYAASARGLLRRVYWLGGNQDKLAAEYVWQFTQIDPHARNLSDGDLAQEIDAKLLGASEAARVADPTLLAVIDLEKMRHDNAKDAAAALSLADLEAQRPRFAADPALFDYLLAAHALFVDGRPAEVVRLIAAEPPGERLGYLSFSRQLLRALALDRVGDGGARESLMRLFPVATAPFQRGALELALAMHDERRGDVERVFAAGSPVADEAVRGILLRHAAGPALLRQRAAAADGPRLEARWAVYILLYKELTRGDYAAFSRDLALLPTQAPPAAPAVDVSRAPAEPDLTVFAWSNPAGRYPCPDLRDIAARLARDPRAVEPRLCVGEFTRLEGFDNSPLDSPPPADELGGAPSRFPGGEFARMAIYKSIIADPAAPAADKAYALYRAIYCYAPSGHSDCGGPESPVSERKAWFETLKHRYASLPWAAQTTVYW
ncbi:MAG TPA: hypothetical protein VG166_04845 [Caulobacteraceae bacterium]|nr:hypothetical protein [Caulobacteraceae bacterium]